MARQAAQARVDARLGCDMDDLEIGCRSEPPLAARKLSGRALKMRDTRARRPQTRASWTRPCLDVVSREWDNAQVIDLPPSRPRL